jgi:hypothetical protein
MVAVGAFAPLRIDQESGITSERSEVKNQNLQTWANLGHVTLTEYRHRNLVAQLQKNVAHILKQHHPLLIKLHAF